MKKKLTSQQQHQEEQHASAQQQTVQQGPLEFATVDQMLRHDALHTPVPPAIDRRLQDSLDRLPPPTRPWWQRWFGS